jgi:arylsulfatase A-like enzyme
MKLDRIALVAFVLFAWSPSVAEEQGFTPLFDGKSFEGWEGNLKHFRIEEGAIVAGSLKEPIPRNEFLCTTREFGDFELRLKAKLAGEGNNAGIQFRSRRIPNHHEVSGYQCDMGDAFGRSVWGALYDESRRNRMLAEGNQAEIKRVFRPGDWNEFVIRCEGPRVQIWLNGVPTVDYEEQEDVPRRGVIGLQIHGGKPAEASYREIRIRELKPPADAVDAAQRPNIVWILAEDSSIHFYRLYGNDLSPTPHIERLASEGLVYDHAFSCAPVCSVARTTLMSGMYAPRVGFQYHRRAAPARLPEGAEMFPAYLRQVGYYTTNNAKKDYNIVEGEVWDESSTRASWRNRPSPRTPFFHMQTYTLSHESSLHFDESQMRSQRTAVDPGRIALPPYHPDTPTFRYTHARLLDRVAAVDAEVGKLVALLEEDGLLENTIIFFFGDHGGVLPRSKGYLYETGLHTPLVVRVPPGWREELGVTAGQRLGGFVNFVDFGPTVLQLAGAEIPGAMDGKPFLGQGVLQEEVNVRDEAFGYSDRFDEKYDLSRSLRKGRYKYIRHYQAFYPDALQNNYRYKMLAYQEWRDLHGQGKLNELQAAFFQAKPAEALYDLASDPHETRNLAGDPAHAKTLRELRNRLQQWVKGLPDLSFFPESHLVKHALPDGAAFGKAHAEEIAGLLDIADLALLPYADVELRLRAALGSKNPRERYWALIACSCFGEAARPLAAAAKERLADPEPLVRVRAAEFLALAVRHDPRPALYEALSATGSPWEALLALNTVVFLRDRESGYNFARDQLKPAAKSDEVNRRLEYLTVGP